MTSKTYRLSPLAEADLEDIWFYTLERWSLNQADKYIRDLISTFEDLAASRVHGRNATVREGYLKHACGSHVIYFRDRGDWLEIVRILHGARDVERHL